MANLFRLALTFLFVPISITKGGLARHPHYLKNHCLHEHEILWGIKEIFERLGNVQVVYIVFTWLPWQLLKEEVFWEKIGRFQPKIPIIQIATKLKDNILSSKNVYATDGSENTDNKDHLHLEKQSPVISNSADVGSHVYDPPDNKNVENKHPHDASNGSSGNNSTFKNSSEDEKEELWHFDDKSSLIIITQKANREHSYNFNTQKDDYRQLNEAKNMLSMTPYDRQPVGQKQNRNDAKFVGVMCQEIVLGALRERRY